MMILLMTV